MYQTTFKVYYSAANIPKNWDHINNNNVLLQTPFLTALELSAPANITNYYVAVFKNNKMVGVAILQRVQMYADDIFRNFSNNFIKNIAKRLISSIVRGNGIVLGNLMHTGQHGFYYNSNEISENQFIQTIFDAINEVEKIITTNFNKKVRMLVCKDYFINTNEQAQQFFLNKKFVQAQVQPNMLFTVNPEWKTTSDYLQALKKKYRDRFKRARKKAIHLQRKELDLQAIQNNQEAIYRLYEHVSNNAGVNTFKLNKNHFYTLKKQLQNKFKLFAYYLEDELVGFYTLIINNTQLETYFLGYDKAKQNNTQMYLNMLYDMLIYGIQNNFKQVVYARTAMEIKSSVGAKPKNMHIYLKHTNNLFANKLIAVITKRMNPVNDWVERHPFRD